MPPEFWSAFWTAFGIVSGAAWALVLGILWLLIMVMVGAGLNRWRDR